MVFLQNDTEGMKNALFFHENIYFLLGLGNLFFQIKAYENAHNVLAFYSNLNIVSGLQLPVSHMISFIRIKVASVSVLE